MDFAMKDVNFDSNAEDQDLRLQLRELKSNLEIDLKDLSDALVKQSTFLYEAKNLSIYLIAVRDKKKRQLEEEYSEVYMKIRKDYTANGEKFTEALLNSEVSLSNNIILIHDELLLTNRAVGVSGALVDAYHSRGYMLRELCSLHGEQYRAEGFRERKEGEYDDARQEHADARKTNV